MLFKGIVPGRITYMRYKDSFGEVKKIRLSAEDRAVLVEICDQIQDAGVKNFIEAVVKEYDLKRAAYVKRCEESGDEVLDDFGTGFEIYVPEYLKEGILNISGIAPSLKDFVDQF